jgi:uncharacterized protein (TIGR03437 family)
VEYLGWRSNAVTMAVTTAAPGIFTLDGSGQSQASMANEDHSFNTPQSPADKGSIVTFYVTGEGQTSPLGEDGKLAVVPLPEPVLPVSVTIGGIEAHLTYRGAAPDMVAGVMQVNAQVPFNAPTGTAVPLVVKVGDVSSGAGVTMAVR